MLSDRGEARKLPQSMTQTKPLGNPGTETDTEMGEEMGTGTEAEGEVKDPEVHLVCS